jgi:hypothetical protein
MSLHAFDDASSVPAPVVRARHLARTARVSRLGAAIERAGSTKAAVARAWGVDERIVRDVCAGLRPLDERRLDACPASVRKAFHEAALEGLDDGAPASSVRPELQALTLTAMRGKLCGELVAALADGRIDSREAKALLRRVWPELDGLRALARVLDALAKSEAGR